MTSHNKDLIVDGRIRETSSSLNFCASCLAFSAAAEDAASAISPAFRMPSTCVGACMRVFLRVCVCGGVHVFECAPSNMVAHGVVSSISFNAGDINTCVCAGEQIDIYLYLYFCACVRVFVHVCVCICAYVCVYVYIERELLTEYIYTLMYVCPRCIGANYTINIDSIYFYKYMTLNLRSGWIVPTSYV